MPQSYNFIKKEALAQVFACEFCEISKNIFFYRTPLVAASGTFPKHLGKKLKFQKTETPFCRWKSTDNNDINILLSLENPCTFLLAKEKTWKCVFNTNSELSQNRTEKQIMPFKTTVNWLFNNIWCYLVIGCFDWKNGIFQQTVIRGLLYT